MTNLTPNAQKFLTKRPTLIGIVMGHKFYEHPTYGDESPLVVITPEGRIHMSDFYELPSVQELGFNLELATRGA